ncbi:alpha carbonic anhydrase 7-like [Arachis stenosperma]|uniref:alpha carbonic anhydrase 7-like n=1 Tax=Arachis stenosperma TaxID=217475 RepID=UPI0025AD53F6|nr:alpha carbonic anhydrase 7-like [Arachis stenosperma]
MMMKQQSRIKISQRILLILVTIFLIHSTKIWTSAEEVENEREFDYIKGSEKGPSHWGELNKEWEACKNGEIQSPIDLSNKRVTVVPNLGVLRKNYKPHNATLVNRGHDISLRWNGDAGSIDINGTQLFLKQCHWHSPSEHTINGRRYDMELHMVHESPEANGKTKVAVVGLLFKIGRPNPILSKLSNYIKSLVDKEEEKNIGVFDPSEIKFGGKKYYRYMGSLTVPPCTEGVIWTINKKVGTVSREQINLLREAVHDHAEKNARPTQPLNRRGIQFYNPKRKE